MVLIVKNVTNTFVLIVTLPNFLRLFYKIAYDTFIFNTKLFTSAFRNGLAPYSQTVGSLLRTFLCKKNDLSIAPVAKFHVLANIFLGVN
jgi:hypothetical protein